MAKISRSVVDATLRTNVFEELDIENSNFVKINDRQYGIILTDANGSERYVRVGVIVAEEREDMTARELMNKEIEDYNLKVAKREEKAKAKAEKAKAEKEKREAEGESSPFIFRCITSKNNTCISFYFMI